MAKEINLAYFPSSTLYTVIKTADGRFVSGTTIEAFNAAHWTSYAVSLPEVSAGSGQYAANFPSVAAGSYTVDVYTRAGATPAVTDGPPNGSGSIVWDGSAEVFPGSLVAVTATGLDAALDLAGSIGGGSLREAFRAMAAVLAGDVAESTDGSGTTTTTIDDFADSGTPRITSTETQTTRTVTVN